MKAVTIAASVIALAWANAAGAQVTPPGPIAPNQPNAPIPQTPTSDDGKASSQAAIIQEPPTQAPQANDIIVTAQRRSERLVDVPISITSVGPADLALAGSDSLLSLNKLVPGLYINRPVYFVSPTIRGIGSTLSLSNESDVAIYIDGVYQSNQNSNVFDLASISGIEVLKGPQGTLFGRNATGGAMLIKTLDPSTGAVAGRFNLSYGNFRDLKASAYLNVPLGEHFAANAAVASHFSDGYIRDLRSGGKVNQSHNYTARGKLLIKPTDSLKIVLTASHSEFDDPTGSDYSVLGDLTVYRSTPAAQPIANDPYHTSHDILDAVQTNSDEYTAHVSLDTDFGTLTSISAIKDDLLYSSNDLDSTYLVGQRVDFKYHTHSFSQEINFTSPSNRPFTYVLGGYYFNFNSDFPFYKYALLDFLFANRNIKAYAGYADGTLQLGKFAVIAGIRYSTETRNQTNGLYAPFVPANASRSQVATDKKFTPRFGLRYALADHANIYATYSKGFKSGGFDGTSLTNPGVTPETVDAYEVGFKASSRVFTFSTAAFYYDYKDIQANAVVINAAGVAVNSLVNAARAHIYGFEADGTAQLSRAFDVRLGFAYTHARYVSFPTAPAFAPLPTGGNTSIFVDASNHPMVRSPDVTVTASANYKVELGSHELQFSLSPSYTSTIYFDFPSTQRQGPVFLLDGSIGFTLAKGAKVSVFGRNLTNKIYYNSRGASATGTNVTYNTPRTYGVALAYTF